MDVYSLFAVRGGKLSHILEAWALPKYLHQNSDSLTTYESTRPFFSPTICFTLYVLLLFLSFLAVSVPRFPLANEVAGLKRGITCNNNVESRPATSTSASQNDICKPPRDLKVKREYRRVSMRNLVSVLYGGLLGAQP